MLWDQGNRQGGFDLLNSYLGGKLGSPPFIPRQQLFESELFSSFYHAIIKLMLDTYMLRSDFQVVFPEMWKLDPSQYLVVILLQKDFSKEVYSEMLDPFEEVLELEIKNGEEEFSAIVDVLVESATKGILGADPSERPNGGRSVLSIQEISNVQDSKWGKLKELLLNKLPEAYATCPPTFWEKLALEEPEDVFFRFLHDLFLIHCSPVEVVESRWKLISNYYKPYSKAVLESFQALLNSNYNEEYLLEIVHVDAGFILVENGRKWLESLYYALTKSDFRELISE